MGFLCKTTTSKTLEKGRKEGRNNGARAPLGRHCLPFLCFRYLRLVFAVSCNCLCTQFPLLLTFRTSRSNAANEDGSSFVDRLLQSIKFPLFLRLSIIVLIPSLFYYLNCLTAYVVFRIGLSSSIIIELGLHSLSLYICVQLMSLMASIEFELQMQWETEMEIRMEKQ